MNTQIIKEYLDNQKIKVVEVYDFENKKVKYNEQIKGWKIDKFRGDEEIVRAYILAKLVNEHGYPMDKIELEKTYDIGRPKVNKPRIDIIVKDDDNRPFLYMELKSPSDYIKNQDETIEKQLYNLASQEQEKPVKYMVLYACDTVETSIQEQMIIIDRDVYSTFDIWKEERNYADTIPSNYGLAKKEPYIKNGKKDLNADFTPESLDSLRKELHNVLWGGGGTDDNDIFSSLVNIILAKIQDESEKNTGEEYDFQVQAHLENNKEVFESNENLFNRINELYRRALLQRLNIRDKQEREESFVIDKKKFSLNKLKYTVAKLESLSFVDGKNNLTGKDILGDFFEGIIREGFKQSKGQFFTHINIVRFMLWGMQLDKLAIDRINKDTVIPYFIDPSAGSGTFAIEYMRFITDVIKYRFNDKINKTRDIEDSFHNWVYPHHRENKWAKDYIYASELNFNLGTATKVNMILHGDGSTNIFVKDGLSPFAKFTKETEPNALNQYVKDKYYADKSINGQFDCILTNPPFSVDLDVETKNNLKESFLFGDKKNSENLFIERYYQLLRPNGRLGVVLPESVFDTTENKYIRLFVYKYFKVKGVVSLPQVTFEPFTSTKTSILFAQKKTSDEIKIWDDIWTKYSKEWSELKTRVENLMKVYLKNESRDKKTSIKDLTEEQEKDILVRMLKNYIDEQDKALKPLDIITKYQDELGELCKFDKDTQEQFGYVNTWWVFGEVVQELSYDIFMAEVENVGYKRTKRGEKSQANELYRVTTLENGKEEIQVNDNVMETALDYLRGVQWD